MEQKKCSFCGGFVELGTGKMYVRREGTIYFFCSSKCENNHMLGRIPRRVAWTEQGRLARKKL
ncbi:MAG TPA: 50S ribosomal protein L24e [Candidatus Acidoferrales bacterium]|nr:50S ribosomal protein L24e [Candidatus Acidoferrales bacterium]HYA60745.1 50S ribosomal protein L24e [Candidatus Acidoferrum sp.]